MKTTYIIRILTGYVYDREEWNSRMQDGVPLGS